MTRPCSPPLGSRRSHEKEPLRRAESYLRKSGFVTYFWLTISLLARRSGLYRRGFCDDVLDAHGSIRSFRSQHLSNEPPRRTFEQSLQRCSSPGLGLQ